MTAPAFIRSIWSGHGQPPVVTDRNVHRLQKIGLAPAGKRAGNALMIWRPEHHTNMLITGALQETGRDLEWTVKAWREAKIIFPQRMVAVDFTNKPTTEHDGSHLAAFQGSGNATANLADFIRMWSADVYERDGLALDAAAERAAMKPDRILPADTLGEALDRLIDRLTGPDGDFLGEAMMIDGFRLDFMWGGRERAVATISYQGSLLQDGVWYRMTWRGYFAAAVPSTQTHTVFRTSRSVGAPIFLQLAEAWAKSQAALADADPDPDPSSAPPTPARADGNSESETPAPGRAGVSKALMGFGNAIREPATYRSLPDSGFEGRSPVRHRTRLTTNGQSFFPDDNPTPEPSRSPHVFKSLELA